MNRGFIAFRLDSVASGVLKAVAEVAGRLLIAAIVIVAGLALIFWAKHIDGSAAAPLLSAESSNGTKAAHVAEQSILTQAMDELGFALLIAAGVWLIFELQLRLRSEKEFHHRLSSIARNVFDAVLGNNLPSPFIDEVKRVALGIHFIRKGFSAHYTLSDQKFEREQGVFEGYVQLIAELSFTVVNVSPSDRRYLVAAILPNPLHEALKELVAVKIIDVILHEKQVKLDLEKAEKSFRRSLASATGSNVRYEAGSVVLRPDEELFVKIEIVMAKEVEDSELLELVSPCDGLSVTITETNSLQPRRIFARSIHRLERDATPTPANPCRFSLRIDDYFLPHQGFLLGWKRNLDKPAAQPPSTGAVSGDEVNDGDH